MKNLILAVCGLIIIIIAVFVFSSKGKPTQDTTIPTPVSIITPSPDISNLEVNKKAQTDNRAQLPFPLLANDQIKGKRVKILTNKGEIVFELFAESPIASSNFIYLTNKKFYDGLTFHRVIKGFMIQGGDPKGDGTGGPGYSFADEPVTRSYTRGIVAMANAGPNTNGSQFFIMHNDYQLPPSYTIFGNVISGLDVLDEIANTQVGANDKPLQSVVMKSVVVE